MFYSWSRWSLCIVVSLFVVLPLMAGGGDPNPKVVFETNLGDIVLELNPDKAPISVKNFLDYVKSDFYTGVIFHRVISGFMIQGGGMDVNMQRKKNNPPIKNEAKNGLKNKRGTICYARTQVVDSATSQFFINLVDNTALDHGVRDYGYAVFGKVVEGMNVVDKIGKVKTHVLPNGQEDVPVKPVIILSAKIVGEPETKSAE
jgi:peptidyl-prolyl cis-trans isomerase A (cyclophilin A)